MEPLVAVDPAIPFTEGKAPFSVGDETFETWYKIFGSLEGATQPPLLVLHGGPGIIHDYILPLSDLARQGGRAVIFYDQLGNGRSTHLPSKPAEFWSITLFLAELRSLLAHLHIVTFDVCGHSWGGMLALELALSAADAGLRRVVCVSAPADVPHFMGECARLLGAFPAWVQEGIVMEDRERFRAANDAFDARHTVTTVPPPAEYVRALDSVWGEGGNQSVNVHMFPQLVQWSALGRLHRVCAPVLLVNGRADKVTDAVTAPMFMEIPRCKWVTLDASSHMPFWEERERFMGLVDRWLRAEEQGQPV